MAQAAIEEEQDALGVQSLGIEPPRRGQGRPPEEGHGRCSPVGGQGLIGHVGLPGLP